MFGTFRKLIGNINIVTKGNYITIEGLPSEAYVTDIYKLWRTSKIEDYMFTRRTGATITFNQFFLPDVLYTIEEVLRQPRRGNSFNYRALRKVVTELRENTWISRTLTKQPDILDFSMVRKLNIKMFEHQDDFLATYNDLVPKYGLTGYMLGAVPGSGKTLTGIALSLCLHADVTIIIAPKNAVDKVWAGTLQTRFHDPVTYWASTSNEPLVPGKQYYIFHYEQLGRAVEFFKTCRPHNPVVILDESHNMNEAESLRTQTFVTLCTEVLNCKHTLWASGTPIKAIGNEAIPLLRCIDPLFNADAQERFKKIYGKSVSRAVDILRNRIGLITFKVEKSAVITNAVEHVVKNIEIPNGREYTLDVIRADMKAFVEQRIKYYETNMPKYRAMYDAGLHYHEKQIEHDPRKKHDYNTYRHYIELIRKGYDPVEMRTESMYCNRYELKEIIPYLPVALKENFRNSRSVIKYYMLKVQGEALGRILGKKRTQCNVDMVAYARLEEDIDGARKKTVIFTSYVEVVDKAFELLTAQGYKPLKVYGETNKDLPAIVDKFGRDEDANPLIATYQSLSTAVPLVMASTAVLMNSPFRVHEKEQACARIDRIGQDGSVTLIDVFLKTGEAPNISTRSGDILNWSKEQVASIMGRDWTGGDVLAVESLVDVPELTNEFVQMGLEVFSPPPDVPSYLRW